MGSLGLKAVLHPKVVIVQSVDFCFGLFQYRSLRLGVEEKEVLSCEGKYNRGALVLG